MSKIIIENTISHMTMPREKPRLHFGISLSGDKCERKLWLLFRWAVIEQFSPRMLRLFRRGQREEETMVSDLRSAGVDLKYVLKDQLYIDFGCHVGGSPDGLALSGIFEAPNKPHIVEFKTHNDKSFKLLQNNGVEKAKPMHYTQMQSYIYGVRKKLNIDIQRAFYLAVNKNDDMYYSERVNYNEDFAVTNIQRAQKIALSNRMPEPMCHNPAWFECKYCPCYDFCYKKQLTKEVNCRTCAFSTPEKDGTWTCEKWNSVIPPEAQYVGCRAHVLHPDLMPYSVNTSKSDKWNASYNGVLNGEKGLESKKVIEIFEQEENNNVRV